MGRVSKTEGGREGQSCFLLLAARTSRGRGGGERARKKDTHATNNGPEKQGRRMYLGSKVSEEKEEEEGDEIEFRILKAEQSIATIELG